MLLLGLDLETTGLCLQTDRIIEVGMVLWDTDRNAPLQIYSELTLGADYPEVSDFISGLTGILPEDLGNNAVTIHEALVRFEHMSKMAEYVVAHNGTNFDRPMLQAAFTRGELDFPETPWLDTSVDIPYPESIKTRKLLHLAAEHGFVNPFAHRAFADVLTMLKVLSHYDITEIERWARAPSLTLEAITLAPWKDAKPEGKKDIDLARARGYRWEGATKRWIKTIKDFQLEQEKEHGEFPVRVLEG